MTEHKPRSRYTPMRHVVQGIVLLLFIGTARWGWTLLDRPVLSGTLSASKVLDTIPLSDPLALLERFAAGHLPTIGALTGALLVLLLYGTLGSRTFCGWICPMNAVVELAAFLRGRLGLTADALRVSRSARFVLLAGALLASALTGTAAFEVMSPQGLLWRDLVFGTGLSALAAASGVFALELAVMKEGWCGHLCPLGAFWALVGKIVRRPALRIRFDDKACTRCGDCLHVCPERQIIRFKDLARTGRIPTGECLNCGKCIEHCPEDALRFELFGRRSVRDASDRSNT